MSNISSRISPNKLRRYLNPRYLKSPIVTGTFFLTGAGIITKFIGFFYRIFLSRVFSEESLGIFACHDACTFGVRCRYPKCYHALCGFLKKKQGIRGIYVPFYRHGYFRFSLRRHGLHYF